MFETFNPFSALSAVLADIACNSPEARIAPKASLLLVRIVSRACIITARDVVFAGYLVRCSRQTPSVRHHIAP